MIVYLMAAIGFIGMIVFIYTLVLATEDDDIEPPRR